ncbi:PREDICTED: uncharacterized protein LOC104829754 [Haliaeetus leucocephalus]|uniref:uncharacterized protein LOC104829754 n=1 Tax=Haliaeetus leucocephalus TaxID=52644 RepID=UPI00053CDD69|nr:PREDICTED: uncharacterized protein LOC104829754 [Haliaeetus leucocephalus]
MGDEPPNAALVHAVCSYAGCVVPFTSPSSLKNKAVEGEVLYPNKTVKEIEWSFSMFNKTALKIRALEQSDSGVYRAWIKLHLDVVENQSFNLSVYRLVPVPGIQHQLLSLTTQGCNVTLWCWVPAGSDAEAIWQLSSSPRTPWGQLCEDSQTLCLAMPASTFNSSYTCVARNPIQEKNTSIPLDALCQQGTPDWWRWHMCLGPLAMGVGALLNIIWLRRKKRRKKAAKGAALTSPSSKDALSEPFYAEIQRRTPPRDA